MPAKPPTPDATPPGLADAAPSAESQDSDIAAAGREFAEETGTSGTEEFSSAAERRSAERTARRQRAEVPGAQSRPGHGSPQSAGTSMPAWTSMRDSVPSPLIAVIAGGVLGAILGALGIAAWVVGLLAAGLTVVLLRALSSPSSSKGAGA